MRGVLDVHGVHALVGVRQLVDEDALARRLVVGAVGRRRRSRALEADVNADDGLLDVGRGAAARAVAGLGSCGAARAARAPPPGGGRRHERDTP